MRSSGASEGSGCLGLSRLGKAEGVGFEPTEAFTSPVFKTGAINHSTTFPNFNELQSQVYELYVVVFAPATEYLVVTEHPSYCWVDKSLA